MLEQSQAWRDYRGSDVRKPVITSPSPMATASSRIVEGLIARFYICIPADGTIIQ